MQVFLFTSLDLSIHVHTTQHAAYVSCLLNMFAFVPTDKNNISKQCARLLQRSCSVKLSISILSESFERSRNTCTAAKGLKWRRRAADILLSRSESTSAIRLFRWGKGANCEYQWQLKLESSLVFFVIDKNDRQVWGSCCHVALSLTPQGHTTPCGKPLIISPWQDLFNLGSLEKTGFESRPPHGDG